MARNRIFKRANILKVIFGLGNIGFRYNNTRHNIGFTVCKKFAKNNGWRINNKGFLSRYAKGNLNGEEIYILLPNTYMNKSGLAVKEFLNQFPSQKQNLLVVSDDFMLPLGSIRIRQKGSSGGHNGLASICDNIGSDFNRLRVGIGPKPNNKEIVKFVLGSFKWRQRKEVKDVTNKACDALHTFVSMGVTQALSIHNN